MVEQSVEQLDINDDLPAVETAELPREPTDYEKRLRRDLARYREQVRIAQSERDAHVAAATRDRDEAITSIRNQATDRVIRSELKTHALRAGIIDLDGLRLADLSQLSLSESGEVVGADTLLASLRQDKPYLFSEPRSGINTGTTSQMQRPPMPAAPSTLDARTMSRDAWQAERDRLLGSL